MDGTILASSLSQGNGWVLVRHKDGTRIRANVDGTTVTDMFKLKTHFFNLVVMVPNGTDVHEPKVYWGYIYMHMDVIIDDMHNRVEGMEPNYDYPKAYETFNPIKKKYMRSGPERYEF